MRARFDRIFRRRTGFATLDRLLERLHANKAELLVVLDRPEIPLHTNGSENDIRCQVTKRKISGGTRSDRGRDCRDAFLGLAKTCAKLGLSFWDYLGARLNIPNHPVVPPLPSSRQASLRRPLTARPFAPLTHSNHNLLKNIDFFLPACPVVYCLAIDLEAIYPLKPDSGKSVPKVVMRHSPCLGSRKARDPARLVCLQTNCGSDGY